MMMISMLLMKHLEAISPYNKTIYKIIAHIKIVKTIPYIKTGKTNTHTHIYTHTQNSKQILTEVHLLTEERLGQMLKRQ